jgi:hypothetical protein
MDLNILNCKHSLLRERSIELDNPLRDPQTADLNQGGGIAWLVQRKTYGEH